MKLKCKTTDCGYKQGALPSCSPLALTRMPMQSCAKPQYERGKALARGTLFPGLDLPFMDIVNTRDVANTPLGEIQAIDFCIKELQLYLDSHSGDTEAFEMLKTLTEMSVKAKERYAEQYGPLTVDQLAGAPSYTWTKGPWPWDYTGEEASN